MSFKMKKLFFALILFAQIANSQEQETASVEKSIFGIQTGILGIWVHNELRLSNQFSLRSEIGYDLGIFGGTNYEGDNFILIPSIRVEPRWYYNLDKRLSKGKSISKNSGNFLAVNITYNTDEPSISNNDNVNVLSSIAIIPKWAIKRTYGNHFTFETGFGMGYVKYLESYNSVNGDLGIDLHLRIGYTF